MKYSAIIPARYASTRFPGKPLALLGGKTVIQRVYEQVSTVIDEVFVATDDDRIFREVERFGGRAVMTSANHRSGTDRIEEAVGKIGTQADIIINAAAVADYTPLTYVDQKIKKKEGDLAIPLKRTTDILKYIGENRRPGQIVCGFSMETENVVENSRRKLASKNADMICANSLRSAGAGFGTDTNIITMITAEDTEELELMSKFDAANVILTKLNDISNRKGGK